MFDLSFDYINNVLPSYEPPKWPAASWQSYARDFVKTYHSAAAQRGS